MVFYYKITFTISKKCSRSDLNKHVLNHRFFMYDIILSWILVVININYIFTTEYWVTDGIGFEVAILIWITKFFVFSHLSTFCCYSLMNLYTQLTGLYEYSVINFYIKLSINVILLWICTCNSVLMLLFCYIFLHTSYYFYFLCICSLKELKWRKTVKVEKEALSRLRKTSSRPKTNKRRT